MDAIAAFLARSGDSAYALTRDFKIVQANAAFNRFASENGEGDLLTRYSRASVLEAISPSLRPFYAEAFGRVWATGERWEHDYECSSPDVYRCFHMVVYPVTRDCLIVAHSLRVERPHTRVACPADDRVYMVDGAIRMCSHCRRVQNPSGHEQWDWVPAYLDPAVESVSHGICGMCAAFYWPDPSTSAPPPPP